VNRLPDTVELGMGSLNPVSASQGAAQVIYDNLELWQYESPQLTILNAVVLSWPLSQGQFVMESASSLDGPWSPVPNLWCRTNNAQIETSIPARESMQFFRLRFAP
jgi:hypothetical protein